MNPGFSWTLNQQYLSSEIGKLSEVSFMDRMIEQFSCSTEDSYNIEGTMGMPLPPFVACFSTDILQGNMLGVADEDGHVKLVDTTKQKRSSIIKEWSAHSNAIFDLAWIEKDSKMVTASGDQTARLWDIEKCTTIGNFRGHTCSLKSIAVQPRSSRILLTGARDGNIMLWDTQCNLKNGYHTPVNTIRKAHERPDGVTNNPNQKKRRRGRSFPVDSKQSVTAAVFLDDTNIISTGACDGAIKYWDLRKNYSNLKGEALPYHVINFTGKAHRKHGFSSLILNSTCSRLFAVCTNDIIYEFPTTNLSTRPIATYQGHRASSFYVKAALSPSDRYLLCGSGDNFAYVWRTDQPNMDPWTFSGHSGEVTSVAWSPTNGEKLVTCSDDNTFKVWRLFQDSFDPSLSCGMVKRKTAMEDIDDAEKESGVTLNEDILELDIPEKKPKCMCRSLNLASSKRVRVRWNIGVVHHINDTVDKARPKTKISLSPFTVIASKGKKAITPNNLHRDKLEASSNVIQVESSGTTQGTTNRIPQTPKSSRVMETWLNSPPAQHMKEKSIHEDSKSSAKIFHFPDSVTPKKCFVDSTNSIKDAQCGSSNSPLIIPVNRKSSPVTLSKKKSPGRSKNSRQSHDIKTMLLTMKRKCKSPINDDKLNEKRMRSDVYGEEDRHDLPRNDTNVFGSSSSTSVWNKENISNKVRKEEHSPKSCEVKISVLASNISINGDTSLREEGKKEVKDILDYAGDI